MYQFIVENKKGEKLELSQNPNYSIIKILGLTPAAAIINTSIMGNFDGEKYNSSRVGTRNIVLTIRPERNIELSRIALYQYFKPKEWCRLYFKNGTRDVYIDGYVETFDGDLFELGQVFQISIICTQPYFLLSTQSAASLSRVISLFEFPFAIAKEGVPFSEINTNTTATIINTGDVETGLIIRLTAIGGSVVGPTIYNVDTKEAFPLQNLTMEDNDIIEINTNQGEKKITKISKGITTNIISEITTHVDWFQVSPGNNMFTFTCASGKEFLQLDFSINEKFLGV